MFIDLIETIYQIIFIMLITILVVLKSNHDKSRKSDIVAILLAINLLFYFTFIKQIITLIEMLCSLIAILIVMTMDWE